jgi:hypothetical protein
MLAHDLTCFGCLSPGTARLLLDKQGRPYLTCIGCGTRMFMPGFMPQLNGVALLEPLGRALVEDMARDRTVYDVNQQRVSRFISEIRAKMHGDALPPPGAAATTPGGVILPARVA